MKFDFDFEQVIALDEAFVAQEQACMKKLKERAFDLQQAGFGLYNFIKKAGSVHQWRNLGHPTDNSGSIIGIMKDFIEIHEFRQKVIALLVAADNAANAKQSPK